MIYQRQLEVHHLLQTKITEISPNWNTTLTVAHRFIKTPINMPVDCDLGGNSIFLSSVRHHGYKNKQKMTFKTDISY